MRIATIDVGTNSTRLLVADVVNEEVKQLFKTGRVTRLGRGVKRSGRLSREGIEETLKALREFKDLLENYSPDRVVVVTTEAARLAENSEEFLSRVRELGFEIELLPEREEAELVFRANLLHFKPSGKAMTIDLGGGSTEIVFGDVNGIELLRSLKFGVVFLYESFLKSDPPERGELLSMESFIEKELKPIRESIGNVGFEVYAVGGTITSVVAMEEKMKVYRPEIVHGYTVTREMVEKWYSRLSSIPSSERKKVVGLEEGRVDVIVPGLAFFKVFCRLFGVERLTVSELGLLYGLVLREVKK